MLLARNQDRSRAETVDGLRRLLPRLEAVAAQTRVFPLGLPELDANLPRGGLAAGALHEVVPETKGDAPAAFGFVAALLCRVPWDGPLLFIASSLKHVPEKWTPVFRPGHATNKGPRAHPDSAGTGCALGLADCGCPHGHGLNRFGLDPARVMLVEAGHEVQALWALEEALHSAAPAAVVGAIEKNLDLKTSQRLHIAAGKAGRPLLLLRPAGTAGSSATATRWRIGAARSAPDRFGLIASWRWRVKLERCRNGRPGEWLVEWDHAAYRFSLAAPMADPALPRSAGPRTDPRVCAAGAGGS